ncbi:hypothetical protein [Natronomonas marina]|jgi:hypothetical protein|uniref:hypothetical protein n=1 Tax=Natronomonas marina TaxID=2961939 RepID=UPI0020C966E9|nr:hypothetical protein [Natronomonas marina]
MKLSRRGALRAAGGLLAGGGLAGCVERRVTRRETNVESSTTWDLDPGAGEELDASAFEAYVEEMANVYGDSGVWGLVDPEAADFEAAYAQRLPIVRESSGQPGGDQPTLSPDEIDREDGHPILDAAVSMYGLGDSTYRYWLWAAVDVRNDTFPTDADATVLSTGVSVRDGTVTRAAAVARDGDATPTGNWDGGIATVDVPVDGGDTETVGRFPLYETTDSVGTAARTEADGHYVVEWSGGVDGVQSANGVCEVERSGEYDLGWSVGGGYRRVDRV